MVYFEVGLPENHTAVEASSLNITPRFVSIYPNTGSIGGTVITAVVPGATKTSIDIDIQDDTNTTICDSVTVVSYGVV